MDRLLNFLKGRIRQIISIVIVIAFFSLLVFGLWDALLKEKHELVLGVVSVCFVFAYLMLKIPSIKDFFVGGKHLNISVNQKKEIHSRISSQYCEPKNTGDYDDEIPNSLS